MKKLLLYVIVLLVATNTLLAFSETDVRYLRQICNYLQVDYRLMLAIAEQESDYNWSAIGNHGELGAFQVKPGTFLWLRDKVAKSYGLGNLEGVSAEVFYTNHIRQMEAATLYVRWLMDQYPELDKDEKTIQVLLRYNASSRKDQYATEVMMIYKEL